MTKSDKRAARKAAIADFNAGPTVADLLAAHTRRDIREVNTALVREHQAELRERGIPTGPDAGPLAGDGWTPDLLSEREREQARQCIENRRRDR